jgi:hypothetical protein
MLAPDALEHTADAWPAARRRQVAVLERANEPSANVFRHDLVIRRQGAR